MRPSGAGPHVRHLPQELAQVGAMVRGRWAAIANRLRWCPGRRGARSGRGGASVPPWIARRVSKPPWRALERNPSGRSNAISAQTSSWPNRAAFRFRANKLTLTGQTSHPSARSDAIRPFSLPAPRPEIAIARSIHRCIEAGPPPTCRQLPSRDCATTRVVLGRGSSATKGNRPT